LNARPPTPAQIRAAAASLVAGTLNEGRSLDDLLADDPDEGSARGLKRSLVYGTLRWHFRLAEILRRLADRPPEQMPPTLRALLEVGLFQLLSGETAVHAAVAETVNAARELGHGRAAGFVNALLRRFQREREPLLAAVDADLPARTAHPAWFVEQLQRERPAEAVAILEANNVHPPMWLRVNRRRWTVPACAAALAGAGFEVERHPFAPDALRIEPAVDVRALPGFAEGRVSVQDAAAQLAVELLAPRAGERILDACAAPGGKTCHTLERVDGTCELTAVDISAARLGRVRDSLARLGLEADLRAGDAAEPATWWDGRPYDRILLDVPCSATGVIRRHPDIKVLRRARDIPALARRQAQLLRAAWELLAPGGTLLYTSCSVLQSENEAVVRAFLAAAPDAADRTSEGTRGWPARSGEPGPGYLVRPGEAGMDGFYYACLTKRP
jgi:16S rRNA (cytosine967-C5)-methyltransferase